MLVGFIIDNRLRRWPPLWERLIFPYRFLPRWQDRSPMLQMRFRSIATEVKRATGGRIAYEHYRCDRHYDAVVFLKSMGGPMEVAVNRVRSQGAKVIFEANVDYYSKSNDTGLFPAMTPTTQQRADAISMTTHSDAVITSSSRLADICREFNPVVEWIPDNVEMSLITNPLPRKSCSMQPLQLWWSGEAIKMVDLLVIENVLLANRDHVHLNLVTNSMAALSNWGGDLKNQFESLLSRISVTMHNFNTIGELLRLYERGGLIISPRFLDHPYNQSHSEWKVTLGMAAGLPALCSPVPSYLDVMSRSHDDAIRICYNDNEWNSALHAAISGEWNLQNASIAAREVVGLHYSTPVVARKHLSFVQRVVNAA